MTAEVAVMNKSAVALAADSAVTISRGVSSHSKVFNTANKLFTLSKYQPIGIMVYNTMELGGVPWETIIKEFRKYLGENSLNTVEEYCNKFFDFLCGNEILFPPEQQKAVVNRIIDRQFRAQAQYIENKKNNKDDFVLKDYIDNIINEYEDKKFPDGFDLKFEKKIESTYSEDIRTIAKVIFSDFDEHAINAFVRYGILILSRDVEFDGYSGIVITGFGNNEMFPQLYEFYTDAIILNQVKRKLVRHVSISDLPGESLSSKVIPFAQDSATTTILEGINPYFRKDIELATLQLIAELPEKIISKVSELKDEEKENYLKDSAKPVIDAFRNFSDKLKRLREQSYIGPIEEAISVMPIGELATVAEVFVNLEQIQQRMSLETETVGGPIDVAVISKHDGFVWIKRKHYFDIKLNPGFVETYFR